jgi:hypothetical protein
MVHDVIAVVAMCRGVERHQPQAIDSQLRQIVEAIQQSPEITNAVTVGVEVGLYVEAIDDGVLPPSLIAAPVGRTDL